MERDCQELEVYIPEGNKFAIIKHEVVEARSISRDYYIDSLKTARQKSKYR
jgi:hypothetical protein